MPFRASIAPHVGVGEFQAVANRGTQLESVIPLASSLSSYPVIPAYHAGMAPMANAAMIAGFRHGITDTTGASVELAVEGSSGHPQSQNISVVAIKKSKQDSVSGDERSPESEFSSDVVVCSNGNDDKKETATSSRWKSVYTDYSRIPAPPEVTGFPSEKLSLNKTLVDAGPCKVSKNPPKEPTFPMKLHMILSDPKYEDIISWMPHGRSWRVLKPEPFEDEILPKFFCHSRLSSFMRQVNGWGFRRIKHGPDFNSYYNELFLRGLPHLAERMRRQSVSSRGGKWSGKKAGKREQNGGPVEQHEPEPDLYQISKENPLPPLDGGLVSDPGDSVVPEEEEPTKDCKSIPQQDKSESKDDCKLLSSPPRSGTAESDKEKFGKAENSLSSTDTRKAQVGASHHRAEVMGKAMFDETKLVKVGASGGLINQLDLADKTTALRAALIGRDSLVVNESSLLERQRMAVMDRQLEEITRAHAARLMGNARARVVNQETQSTEDKDSKLGLQKSLSSNNGVPKLIAGINCVNVDVDAGLRAVLSEQNALVSNQAALRGLVTEALPPSDLTVAAPGNITLESALRRSMINHGLHPTALDIPVSTLRTVPVATAPEFQDALASIRDGREALINPGLSFSHARFYA